MENLMFWLKFLFCRDRVGLVIFLEWLWIYNGNYYFFWVYVKVGYGFF